MFGKDSRTENFLSQMGVEFTYTHQVSFDELAKNWDVVNLARPVAIRDDAVDTYKLQADEGSIAPAPILYKVGALYEVLDGVQRLVVAKLRSITIISAYVVTCDSLDIVTAIRVLANARLQGRTEPAEWTRRRAVEILVLERKLSPEEVAKMGGWRAAEITALARTIDWGFQIRCIGGPQKLPDTMIDCISRHTTQAELRKAPVPIAAFMKTLHSAQFSAADAEPFVEQFFSPISSKNRHEAYAERLQEFIQEPECQVRIGGRKSMHLARDVAFLSKLKAAKTQGNEMIRDGEVIHNVDEIYKLLHELNSIVKKLAPKRGKPGDSDKRKKE